jgi:hypothetical protein
MKRIITIICAFAFSGAALSAQNLQERIDVRKDGENTTITISTKEDISNRDIKRLQRVVNRIEREDVYMTNVGFRTGYRADIELAWDSSKCWSINSSHGYSFGNGLYVGGGAGFGAVLTPMEANTKSIDSEGRQEPESTWNATYFTPVFADVKYSFLRSFATPFINLRGGATADISNSGVALFITPSIGIDIARFCIKIGYERQLGVWGSLDNTKTNNVKLSIGYTF